MCMGQNCNHATLDPIGPSSWQEDNANPGNL